MILDDAQTINFLKEAKWTSRYDISATCVHLWRILLIQTDNVKRTRVSKVTFQFELHYATSNNEIFIPTIMIAKYRFKLHNPS